jgi:xanthine dehydrogenase accessory factor
LSTRSLVETFTRWSAETEAMVLVTVVETEGSTYSKAGRHLLIRGDGNHAGLISGGCLEGDLAERARLIMASGEPALVTYDMRDDADDLWGIGLGCNGIMRLLLQRIDAETNWQPFADVATALADPTSHTLSLITASNLAAARPGDCLIDASQKEQPPPWPTAALQIPESLPQITQHTVATADLSVLHWQTQPWVRLLVLGAAPDAQPVVQLASQLGWTVVIADHREHYLQSTDFSAADEMHAVVPGALQSAISLNLFDAIVVMSHHLETDRKYLQELAGCQRAYIGLLGPVARKQKLLAELHLTDSEFGRHLHGPVGLSIGADSPESIALSLLAEIQSVISSATKYA